jgi:hypothetical protein
LTALAALALAGCGGSDAAVDPGLRFTRADGSTIRIPLGVVAWCGPWNDLIPRRALHVGALAGPPRRVSYWRLWAIPRDVESGDRVHSPVEFVWNRPRGVEIFVGDLEDTPGGADTLGGTNEASTQEEESGGWIEFDASGCEVGDEVAFTVDAVLGSEFGDDEPIAVEGSLRLRVGERPPGF